jgi:L-fuculose-phosphate aldolase
MKMTKKEEKKDQYETYRDEIVRIAGIMHTKGFSAGVGSNYSIKIAKDQILITPSGINKAWLQPDQLIQVKMNGEIVSGEGKVSSEFPMHVWIYKALTNAGAIIHSNPPCLTAFAIAGRGLETSHLTEPYLQLGDYIPLVHYATPSTEDLANMFKPYLQPHRKVYIMQNHGVVVIGKDIVEAYDNLEMAENYARIMSLFGLPAPKIIDKSDLKLLNDTFK